VLTKKEVEAIEHFEIDDEGELVAYEDFLKVKETLELAIKALKHSNFSDTLGWRGREFLAKYEGED